MHSLYLSHLPIDRNSLIRTNPWTISVFYAMIDMLYMNTKGSGTNIDFRFFKRLLESLGWDLVTLIQAFSVSKMPESLVPPGFSFDRCERCLLGFSHSFTGWEVWIASCCKLVCRETEIHPPQATQRSVHTPQISTPVQAFKKQRGAWYTAYA